MSKKQLREKNAYFTDAVHQNGRALEDRVETFLKNEYINYKRYKRNGIDFIIEGKIYIDCVAQKVSGSIGDKLPTKIFKYVQKYSLEEIYILHPYSPITKTVADFLAFLEDKLKCRIHILDWNDFTKMVVGGKSLTNRKAYYSVRDSARISNAKVSSYALNKHFN